MNKFFRNLTIFAVLRIILFGSSVLAADHEHDEMSMQGYLIENYGYEFIENYNLALEIVTELYELFPTNRMGDTIYPTYFGGKYINDEGDLVILQIKDATSNESTTLDYFEDAVFKLADFSYTELVAVMDFLDWKITCAESNASTWYLDVINNRVVVQLTNYGADEIAIFQDMILDSPIIVFEQGEKSILANNQLDERQSQNIQSRLFGTPSPRPPALASPIIQNVRLDIRTGDRIWVFRNGVGWIDGAYLSIGYRVQAFNGEIGFVTAAHIPTDMQIGDIISNNSGVRIGVVRQAQLPGIDAAFVATGANVVMSSHTNLAAAGNYNGTFVGQRVVFHGATTGTQVGSILIPRISVLGLNAGMHTTLNFRGGDSGGVIYTIDAAGHVTGTAGIANSTLPIVPYSVVSRADAINNTFGLRLIHGGQPSPAPTPPTPPPPIPGIPGVPPIPPIPPRP